MCGRSPLQGKLDSSGHSRLPNTESTCQQEHTTRRTWLGPWKLDLKRLPNRPFTPAQAELQAAPGALRFPAPSLAGDTQTWVALPASSSLGFGPPTHAREHRGCWGVDEGRVKITPYSCFKHSQASSVFTWSFHGELTIRHSQFTHPVEEVSVLYAAVNLGL